jgi:hypothetical protein
MNASAMSPRVSIASRRKGEWRLALSIAPPLSLIDVCRVIRPFSCFAADSVETSAAFGSLATTMKLEHESVSASDMNMMDSRVIRVDVTPTQAGITAALRRAFEAAASEPCDRDFADLLRRLN